MQAKLKCTVHSLKNPKPGLHFAHIQLGEVWADVPCDPAVVLGDAILRLTFNDYQGRLNIRTLVVQAVQS